MEAFYLAKYISSFKDKNRQVKVREKGNCPSHYIQPSFLCFAASRMSLLHFGWASYLAIPFRIFDLSMHLITRKMGIVMIKYLIPHSYFIHSINYWCPCMIPVILMSWIFIILKHDITLLDLSLRCFILMLIYSTF